MSLFNVLDISGSGMHAQTVRLNTIASNMANVDSVSSNKEDTYRSKQPVFQTILEGNMNEPAMGVRVKEIVENQAPLKMEYSPNHPMANEEGYIFRPNVDVTEEMANMLSASRSYETNIEVMNTSKQLLLRTIQLGK
ncbi:flagellar basal body rod protein FlgC [Thiomicrorhabdus sp. 6S2-11]|jgi:flagellar basal-body rod protein FlgC|uniref:Flagellar basal-body rod protein FlgC n=1 Tax=Thiomicrorhabdus marina TaxID=2818442 RepID=A0ABS3Q865_9GAMM|nr:flagellar basal body rod protein FlgC [Thiomicrorhabdus marina]MBO1928446.1 flagellar basal body rod protein FlgC [Thiomicrorhabdus marina]